jgi:hypothetical protein
METAVVAGLENNPKSGSFYLSFIRANTGKARKIVFFLSRGEYA